MGVSILLFRHDCRLLVPDNVCGTMHSGPLPEDLFSGLENLSVGVSSFEPTSSPAPVMPEASSPLQASHASRLTPPPALHRQACHSDKAGKSHAHVKDST